MSEESAPFEGWAICELMGHRRLGAYVREATVAGHGMLRLDVPGPEHGSIATQYVNPTSLYALTPCSEETARAVARRSWEPPVQRYELAAPVESRARSWSPDFGSTAEQRPIGGGTLGRDFEAVSEDDFDEDYEPDEGGEDDEEDEPAVLAVESPSGPFTNVFSTEHGLAIEQGLTFHGGLPRKTIHVDQVLDLPRRQPRLGFPLPGIDR